MTEASNLSMRGPLERTVRKLGTTSILCHVRLDMDYGTPSVNRVLETAKAALTNDCANNLAAPLNATTSATAPSPVCGPTIIPGTLITGTALFPKLRPNVEVERSPASKDSRERQRHKLALYPCAIRSNEMLGSLAPRHSMPRAAGHELRHTAGQPRVGNGQSNRLARVCPDDIAAALNATASATAPPPVSGPTVIRGTRITALPSSPNCGLTPKLSGAPPQHD
jgi:hypothetical protein